MSGKYDDIIDLPHYEPKKHPRMKRADRAAQFAPFAALTGHSAAIRETAVRTAQAVEWAEEGVPLGDGLECSDLEEQG